MNGGRSIFAARLNPLDRRAEPHGQVTDQRFLGIEVELGAEPAADFRRHDADLVLRHANHRRQ